VGISQLHGAAINQLSRLSLAIDSEQERVVIWYDALLILSQNLS
jgi:hypothetical protein